MSRSSLTAMGSPCEQYLLMVSQTFVGTKKASVRAQDAALTVEKREMDHLRALASARRLALVSKDKLLAELGQAIGRRMVKRSGAQVYQMLTCTLPYFPRDVLQEFIPAESMKEHTEKRILWELASVSEVSQTLGPLLERSTYVCAGSTKAFRTPSERVIRVVAKVMPPFEIRHEILRSGAERCYLNGMYALVTQDLEFHFPKDNERRELGVSSADQLSLKHGVLEDMKTLGRSGHPLSPRWWRQLGEEDKAIEAEKRLAAAMANGRSARLPPHIRQASKEMFEIELIVSEKKGKGKMGDLYLVRWAGYHASWEPWRISGQPGDPIETWEPAHGLRATEAFKAWKNSMRN